MNRTSNARKQNSAAISHLSLLTACYMALAVTSGLSRTLFNIVFTCRTCVVSGLVTHYINAHGHRNLRKEAPMLGVGATGTNKQTYRLFARPPPPQSWTPLTTTKQTPSLPLFLHIPLVSGK
jgi:hypothetical protein